MCFRRSLAFVFGVGILATAHLCDEAHAQSAAVPAAEIPRMAINEGITAGGVRLVHRYLPGETEHSFAFHWRDQHLLQNLDKAGLQFLAPQVAVYGGSRRLNAGALEEEIKDLGVSIRVNRSRTLTLGELSGLATAMDDAAKLVREVLVEPRMPAITLRRRQRDLLASIRASAADGEAMARETMILAVVGDVPLARSVTLRPTSTVSDVTLDDIQNWHRSVLARDNLTVVSAGPLPRHEAERLTDVMFAGLPAHAARLPDLSFEPRRANRTIVVTRQVPQSVLIMGAAVNWSGTGATGVSREIARTALGGSNGRLFIAIREQLGAAYGASASFSPLLMQHNMFSMQASVAHDKLGVARAAMRKEYDTFLEQGVNATIVGANQRRLRAAHADQMRRGSSSASVIRGGLINGQTIEFINRVPDWIDGQKAETINAMIREHLPTELITVIVTPSADGLNADCVIADTAEIERCFAKP